MRKQTLITQVTFDEYEIIDKKLAFGHLLSEAEELSQKQRQKMDSGDFLFKDRTFPISKPSSIVDALHRWSSSKHGLTYEQFVRKLHDHVKRAHPEWIGSFPVETLKRFNIK